MIDENQKLIESIMHLILIFILVFNKFKKISRIGYLVFFFGAQK